MNVIRPPTFDGRTRSEKHSLCSFDHEKRLNSLSWNLNRVSMSIERRLEAGKSGLLELALLKETHRRIVEETINSFSSFKSFPIKNESTSEAAAVDDVLKSESSSIETLEEIKEEYSSSDTDDVFIGQSSSSSSSFDASKMNRQAGVRSTSSSSSSRYVNSTGSILIHCQSKGTCSREYEKASKSALLTDAYRQTIVFSGLQFPYPSPMHAVLGQFDFVQMDNQAKLSSLPSCAPIPSPSFNDALVPSSDTFHSQIIVMSDAHLSKGISCSFSGKSLIPNPTELSSSNRLIDEQQLKDSFESSTNQNTIESQVSRNKSESHETSATRKVTVDIIKGSMENRSPTDGERDFPSGSGQPPTEEGYFSGSESITNVQPEPPPRRRRKGTFNTIDHVLHRSSDAFKL